MNVVDRIELDNICKEILNKAQDKDFYFYNYLLLLYNTGLRPDEALDKSRVVSYDNEYLVFHPYKNNDQRTIPISQIPDTFLSYYLADGVAYHSYYYRRYLRLFDIIANDHQLYIKTKRLKLYVFRYNYINNFHSLDDSIYNLKIAMGWTTALMANKYINEPIIKN